MADNKCVVVERITPGVDPEYCTYGRTTCIGCDEWCWLGNQTGKLVATGDALPICVECATLKVTPEMRIGDVRDRRHGSDHVHTDDLGVPPDGWIKAPALGIKVRKWPDHE